MPARTLILHRIFPAMLAFLVAFTTLGAALLYNLEPTFSTSQDQNTNHFSQFADDPSNDLLSRPFEQEEDERIEDERSARDGEIDGDFGIFILSEGQADVRKNPLNRLSARYNSFFEGKQIPRYILFQCWKNDLNG